MKIVKSPPFNSPAFGEVVFQISAATDELAELNIYANDRTTIIGKKRFKGSTLHKMNVAGYGRRQLEIIPQRTVYTSFAFPGKRTIFIPVKGTGVSGLATVNGGVEIPAVYTKLSKSPDILSITRTQRDELSMLVDPELMIRAEAQLSGRNRTAELTIAAEVETQQVTTFCLYMPDVQRKLQNAYLGTLDQYDTMRVRLMMGADEIAGQTYRLTEERPGQVRLCWWNHYGQIDYYTMNCISQSTLQAERNLIYTQEGHKTVRCDVTTQQILVSDYENEQTYAWISEIVASPSVWIDRGNVLEPVTILSDRVTSTDDKLMRLELLITPRLKTPYPNL